WSVQTPGQITIGGEISGKSAENYHHLIGDIATNERKWSLSPNWLLLHAIPKLGKLIKSLPRFFAGDDGAVNRTYRGADDPVGLDSAFVERLINTALICAERASTLKHQHHLTRKRRCCLRTISHDVHPC